MANKIPEASKWTIYSSVAFIKHGGINSVSLQEFSPEAWQDHKGQGENPQAGVNLANPHRLGKIFQANVGLKKKRKINMYERHY